MESPVVRTGLESAGYLGKYHPWRKGGSHELFPGYNFRCKESGERGGDDIIFPLLWDTEHSQVVMASSIFLSYRKAVALLVKMGYFVQFLCPFCIDTIPGL